MSEANIRNKKRKTAIIGCGASGLVCAYYAAKNPDNTVVIYEKNDIPAKKLRLTGNGRCNFSNEDLSVSHYEHYSYKYEENFCNSMILDDDLKLISSVLEREGRDCFESFLKECGSLTFEKNGYFYPKSERAGELADLIVRRVVQKGVTIRYSTCVTEILPEENGGFTINGERYDHVVLACGGKAAPSTGSDGSGYKLARSMGHYVRFTYPVLVPLAVLDKWKEVSGVRVKGSVVGRINGKEYGFAQGEIQFTDTFISGIPVFQISRHLTKAVEDCQRVEVSLDLLSEVSKQDIPAFVDERISNLGRLPLEEFFEGLLPKKLYDFILKEYREYCRNNPSGTDEKMKNPDETMQSPNETIQNPDETMQSPNETIHNPDEKIQSPNEGEILTGFLEFIKDYRIPVTGHGGFNNAQCTKGGVVLAELTDNLESKITPGLYIIGEMTDVDGECGGYNLQWAFSGGKTVGDILAAGNEE